MFPTLPVPTDTNPQPPTWQALLAFFATLGHLPAPINLGFRAPWAAVSVQFVRGETASVDAWLVALRSAARGAVVQESANMWIYRGEVDDVCGFRVEVWAAVDRVEW